MYVCMHVCMCVRTSGECLTISLIKVAMFFLTYSSVSVMSCVMGEEGVTQHSWQPLSLYYIHCFVCVSHNKHTSACTYACSVHTCRHMQYEHTHAVDMLCAYVCMYLTCCAHMHVSCKYCSVSMCKYLWDWWAHWGISLPPPPSLPAPRCVWPPGWGQRRADASAWRRCCSPAGQGELLHLHPPLSVQAGRMERDSRNVRHVVIMYTYVRMYTLVWRDNLWTNKQKNEWRLCVCWDYVSLHTYVTVYVPHTYICTFVVSKFNVNADLKLTH